MLSLLFIYSHQKGNSQNYRIKGAYATTQAFMQSEDAKIANSKIAELYSTDSATHASSGNNKIKINMKKISSAGIMKNYINKRKYNNINHVMSQGMADKIFSCYIFLLFNVKWLTNSKILFAFLEVPDQKVALTKQGWYDQPQINPNMPKKASKSERRPVTDVHEYRNFDHEKYASVSSNLNSYQNAKKMSKLFKKAGAGRFSQNIWNRLESSTFNLSVNVSYFVDPDCF